MDLYSQLKKVKNASQTIALLNDNERNDLLSRIATKLRSLYHEIIGENAKDLAYMSKDDPMYDRLLLTKARIQSMAEGLETVISLASPLDKQLEIKNMPNGLRIEKISVPLGVVAVIYESRPNVTIDVFTLCFKAGNACVLKGGTESYHSNLFLVKIIQDSLIEQGIDVNAISLLPPSRKELVKLLDAVDLIDVCIPRGGKSLINFIRNNAKVPVIETGAGIVHAYFDVNGDVTKGRNIINNAKTRRVSVCNALDCLIIHKERLPDLYTLVAVLKHSNVEIFADPEAFDTLNHLYPKELLHNAMPDDFGKEFLSYKMSIKTVDLLDEAINHIVTHSSKHSEAIITEDQEVAKYFVARVDAAAVYVNASTAFTDGGQFGMGSEIGISTQKLHARGPMGLEALTSYKWIVYGNGQIRGN